MKKKFWGPLYPPKKADFWRLKAKMGRFSQKGLCDSFEILQGLLSNKNTRVRFPAAPPTFRAEGIGTPL